MLRHVTHKLHRQGMLDPEAAARTRHRRQERKTVGRKRKQEDFQRRRTAGLPVKNKRWAKRQQI